MLFKFFLTNILRTNIALFDKTNHAEHGKKSAIAKKSSAVLALCGFLGVLGRKFNPVAPIQL